MLRAGTAGANPRSRLIDQRERLSLSTRFALSDLFHEPPNNSETFGTNAPGLVRNLGLSKALALLRARCLVLKEQIAQVRQI